MKKTLFLLIIILFSNILKSQIPYAYQEGFESNNPVVSWVSSSGMLSGASASYTFDSSTFTEGSQSLRVDATIPGLANPNSSWYYYLRIPLSPEPNLDDSISFSMDVRMDSITSKNVKIGLNLGYLPASSGLYSFPKLTRFDQWVTIQEADVAQRTSSHAQRWTSSVLYNGNPVHVGRNLQYIGLLMFGKGPAQYTLNIDNLSISGKHTDPSIFRQNYLASWASYIQQVRDSIDLRQDLRDNLDAIPDTAGLVLCPIHHQKITQLNTYLHAIDSILNKMYLKNNSNLHFSPKWMTSLDQYLLQYQHAWDFLTQSLANVGGIVVYDFPAMKYFRLQGDNTPPLDTVTTYNLRMTAGEYQSIGTLISPSCTYGKLSAENTDFTGANGTFSKENLDIYVAKIWYQAGLNNTHKTGKFLVQELLLKNDSLVKVDFVTQTNYLQIRNNRSHRTSYIDISDPNAVFPDTDTITFNDSAQLQAFELDSIRHKLLWSIVHVPQNTPSGDYTSMMSLRDASNHIIKQFPIKITVLPFDLDKSRLTYSLYYHGKLRPNADLVYTHGKRAAQKMLELRDMQKHGVLYPACYDGLSTLDSVLDMRVRAGLPTDRFYNLGLGHRSSAADITSGKNKLAAHGYNSDSLYVYGIDEADTTQLPGEIADIQRMHNLGVRVFTAGYHYTHSYLGDYLDLINYARGATASGVDTQVVNWHNSGQQIFAYASPQVGVENPEVYRKNFGCLLWQKGFDGAMDYAYQKQYGAFWNDFDIRPTAPSYREEAFTYPTSNGIVGTVEWEGYRAAITDVRYISTLLNLRDFLLASGTDVTALNAWINGIDCSSDLDILREEIIDKILQYQPGSTGIEQLSDTHIKVYPNPTYSKLKVLSESSIIGITVLDMNGVVLKNNRLVDSIDIHDLAAGIYVLKIQTKRSVYYEKVMKI